MMLITQNLFSIYIGIVNLLLMVYMGYLLRRILELYKGAIFKNENKYINFLLDILFSLILAAFISLILSYLFLLNALSVKLCTYFIVFFLFLIYKHDKRNRVGLIKDEKFGRVRKISVNLKRKKIIVVYNKKLLDVVEFQIWGIVSVFIGMVFALYWRNALKFPLTASPDEIVHIFRSQYILNRHGFDSLYIANYRPIIFNVLLVYLHLLSDISIYSIVWYGVYFTLPLYSFIVYIFAYSQVKNVHHSILTSLFSTTICGFFSLLGPHYFLPITISIIMMMIYIIALENLDINSSIKWVIIVLPLIVVALIYYYTLIPFMPIIVIIFTRKRIICKKNYSWSKFFYTYSSLVVLYFLFYINSNFYSHLATSFSRVKTYEILKAAYSPIIIILFIIGILINLYFKNEYKSQLQEIIILSVIYIAIIFSEFNGGIRIEYYMRPYIALISALPFNPNIWTSIINNKIKIKNNRINLHKIFWIIIFLFILITGNILSSPYRSFVNKNIPVQTWTGLPLNYNSKDLYNAGIWLKKNSSEKAFFISDFDTSRIIQAVSGKSGIVDPIMLHNKTTALIAYNFLIDDDIFSSLEYLNHGFSHFIYSELYIVVSSSTAKSAIQYYNNLKGDKNPLTNLRVYSPPELFVSFPGDNKFNNRTFFKLVYSSETVKIYLVKLQNNNQENICARAQ